MRASIVAVVQRRESPSGAWVTVYDGEDDFVEDTGLSFTSSYDYRLQAWNALGHSNFTLVTGVRPQTSGCSMPVTLSFSSIMSGITNFFTVITVLIFAYRVRQYARVGGLGAFLMPAAQTYMKYSKSTGALLRTRTGACERSSALVAGLCAGMPVCWDACRSRPLTPTRALPSIDTQASAPTA